MNYASRSLHLDGSLDDEMANDLAAQILFLNADDDQRPIILFINTEGGSVLAGFAVYDVIKYVSAPVWTIGVGVVGGIGAFLLASGAKGFRFILADTQVKLTDISRLSSGSELLDNVAALEVERVRDLLVSALSLHSDRPAEMISQDMASEKSFDSDSAIQYGLVDHVADAYSLLKLMASTDFA